MPMPTAPAGERYGEVKGYYFERRRATFPATIGTRAARAPATSSTSSSRPAASQQQLPLPHRRGRRRQRRPTKKRVLVVAAEDYTGKSPNVDAGYAAAPRYLAQHVAALEAAGYEVETFNIDAPPPTAARPTAPTRRSSTRPYLGVLAHFDAVNYYSGDDFVPQDVDRHRTRADDATPTTQTGLARDGAVGAQGHARTARLRQRGRQAARRRPQRPPAVHAPARACRRTGPYTWTPDKLFGFFYPPNNAG